jgi:hypothetical protein
MIKIDQIVQNLDDIRNQFMEKYGFLADFEEDSKKG